LAARNGYFDILRGIVNNLIRMFASEFRPRPAGKRLAGGVAFCKPFGTAA